MSTPPTALFFALVDAKVPMPAARRAAEALEADIQVLFGQAPWVSPEVTYEALLEGPASEQAARDVAEAIRRNLDAWRRHRGRPPRP